MLGGAFKIKGTNFEGITTSVCTLISAHIYNSFVTYVGKLYTMSELQERSQCFKKFKEARYAVDVTFQNSFRRSGSGEEGNHF